jgi:hypothetical protein
VFFSAEWQTSREQLSFQSGEIGGRIFAEAELLPATFFPLLQLGTQLAPLEIIPRLAFLGREKVLPTGHGSNDPHRTADDHARKSSPSASGAPLMDARRPKALFQLIVGAWQDLDIVALKETRSKVVSKVTKMRNGLSKGFQVGLLPLHIPHKSQIALANLCAGVLRLVGQDRCRLMHQPVGALQRWPQGCRGLQTFGEELLQLL